MRSFNPLFISVLSFVSLVTCGPFHPTKTSRLAGSPISIRQFHHQRSLTATCADISISMLASALGLGSKYWGPEGDICVCLPASLPDLCADSRFQPLIESTSEDQFERALDSLVVKNGHHCTYPDNSSPKCSPENVCDFGCVDGFSRLANLCVCSSPKTVCNGKCGFYPQGCGSAYPKAPRMTRRSISSSLEFMPRASDVDVDACINQVLSTLDLNGPIPGVSLSGNSGGTLFVIGPDVSGTQGVFTAVTDVLGGLLSSLGIAIDLQVVSSSSANLTTVSVDLQLCGLSDLLGLLEVDLGGLLPVTADVLTKFLGITIDISGSVDGPQCPPVTSLPNPSLPAPTISAAVPDPSLSLTLNGSDILDDVDDLLAQITGLDDLELNLGSTFGITTQLTVIVDIELSEALIGIEGLVARILTVLGSLLSEVLGVNVTIPPLTPSPIPSDPGNVVVLGIDLGSVLADVDSLIASNVTNTVATAALRLFGSLPNTNVTVNVDGGSDCGCSV